MCVYVCACKCVCVCVSISVCGGEIKYSMILLHEYRWLASFMKRIGLCFKNSKLPIILKMIEVLRKIHFAS